MGIGGVYGPGASGGRSVACYTSPPSTRSAGCDSRGDVAQLGERRVRIAEARGSSPLISTTVGRLGRW